MHLIALCSRSMSVCVISVTMQHYSGYGTYTEDPNMNLITQYGLHILVFSVSVTSIEARLRQASLLQCLMPALLMPAIPMPALLTPTIPIM